MLYIADKNFRAFAIKTNENVRASEADANFNAKDF